MPEDVIDQGSPPLQEQNEVKSIITYEGPLGYYFRHSGIEEGAHAVLWNIKSETEKGSSQIKQATQSINEVDPVNQQRVQGSREIHCSRPIEEITDEDIADLIEHTDERIRPFAGNKAQAAQYCREFVNGALVPIKKMMREGQLDVKFGLAIPRADENYYDFFYAVEMNIVFINRSTLERLSNYPPDAPATASSDSQEYGDQSHERRALLWQIKDAKEQRNEKLVSLLRSRYKKLE